MEKQEKKYIYRIIVGIIFWLSNNHYTDIVTALMANSVIHIWGTSALKLNIFLANLFNLIFNLISLAGLIITLINAVLLFKTTLNKNK